MALIMSKSEAVAKGNESKNGWMGKTAGPEWLYTDWKCLLIIIIIIIIII
jgi:hypothetical protein